MDVDVIRFIFGSLFTNEMSRRPGRTTGMCHSVFINYVCHINYYMDLFREEMYYGCCCGYCVIFLLS